MQQAFLFSGGKKDEEGKESSAPKGFEKFFKKKEGEGEKKEVSAKKEDKK
jgi:hypothetical protein